MARVGEQCPGFCLLDYLAQIHDRHPVAHVFNDRQIVGDEDICQFKLLLQVIQQVQNPGLDRNIQGRGGFIQNQDSGLQRQRPGNDYPLALASREFMRIPVQVLATEANVLQQFGDPFADVLGPAMNYQGLAHYVLDQHPGVQCPHRVLEDCSYLSPETEQFRMGQLFQPVRGETDAQFALLPASRLAPLPRRGRRQPEGSQRNQVGQVFDQRVLRQ